MCPFTQVKIGGGGGIGFDVESYVWTHGRCIGTFCRLYTYKFDSDGEIYAEGCNFQFLGLSREEIQQNFALKNKIIEQTGK